MTSVLLEKLNVARTLEVPICILPVITQHPKGNYFPDFEHSRLVLQFLNRMQMKLHSIRSLMMAPFVHNYVYGFIHIVARSSSFTLLYSGPCIYTVGEGKYVFPPPLYVLYWDSRNKRQKSIQICLL